MSTKDPPKRSNSQTIIPLSVPIKTKGIDSDRPPRRHRFYITVLIGAFLVMIAGGIWLLHYLSQNPLQPQQPLTDNQPAPEPEPAPIAVTPPEPPPPPAVDPEKLALDKQSAEQKLAEYLEMKNELDGKGAADWGGDSYLEIIDIGRQADALLIKNEFQAASAEYGRATVSGRQLVAQADEILQQFLEAGRIALAQGQGAVAQNKFKVALKIDPANPAAKKGLKRSQTIETVIELIESGKQHEKENTLSQARADYQKALQIDPEANEARQALKRVADMIKEQQFSQLMSSGLTAFHNNNYPLARTRLLDAKSLKPNSREVSDALLQVDQALRLARIERLRGAAQNAEQSEDWQAALKSYRAVLDIDQNLQFAVRGHARAREQIRIAKRLDFYLTRPQVLESDQQLKNAILLVHEAHAVDPQTATLIKRVEKLEALINIAQTPVMVTLESDNLTQIAVYKVGKFGRFSERELKLRPGTYTVVGAREGYQDVRRKIIVKPGQQSLRVTVKCKVKI